MKNKGMKQLHVEHFNAKWKKQLSTSASVEKTEQEKEVSANEKGYLPIMG